VVVALSHSQNLSCAHRSETFPTSSLTFQLLTNCTSDKLNSSSVTEISGRNLFVCSNKRKIFLCCQLANIAVIGYNCWSFQFNLKELWTRKQVLFCSRRLNKLHNFWNFQIILLLSFYLFLAHNVYTFHMNRHITYAIKVILALGSFYHSI